MIKLFENYKRTDPEKEFKLKLINKVEKFIKDLKIEDNIDIIKGEYSHKLTIVDKNNRFIKLFRFQIYLGESIEISSHLLNDKYISLEKYIVSVFSNFFRSEEQYSNMFIIDEFDENIINDIELDVDEYKLFKITNKFGL